MIWIRPPTALLEFIGGWNRRLMKNSRRPNQNPHCLRPAHEAKDSQGRHGQRGNLIAGDGTEQLRLLAQKLVEKTKESVGDQINVEMLAGQFARAAKQDEDNNHRDIEQDFHRHRRPARHSRRIVHREPRRLTNFSHAAAVKPAANAPENNSDWRNRAKPYASDTSIADAAFGEL